MRKNLLNFHPIIVLLFSTCMVNLLACIKQRKQNPKSAGNRDVMHSEFYELSCSDVGFTDIDSAIAHVRDTPLH